MRGLDISKWQGNLSMQSVKEAGYDFVIIRGAYTTNGDSRICCVDPKFEDFYNEAKAVGLQVGVYYYSCADSSEWGEKEAQFLIENCLDGRRFEMPIYLDVEDNNWQKGDIDGVTDACVAFCEYLRARKYYGGVYASKSWFNTFIDYSRLDDYTYWVACWGDKPDMPFSYSMWQDSSDGYVDGVRVDTDYCYVDFAELMRNGGWNGYGSDEPSPAPQPTPEPQPTPQPTPTTYGVGDEVSFSKIFVSSTSTEPLNPLYNSGTITKVIEGARNPYLINDGMGWVNDEVIDGEPSSSGGADTDLTLEVGDSIMIHDGATDMNTGGTYASYVYDTVYTVIQINGNRVVFGLDGVVTGATDINNCIRV